MMEFEKKPLLEALGENTDDASKVALVARLKKGEIKAEGRLIYPEAMDEGRIVLAKFQEIPREHWNFSNVDFQKSEIRNNFIWTDTGNSDQQNWIDILVLINKIKTETKLEKNKGGRPKEIDQSVFNAQMAAYLFVCGDFDPFKKRKELIEKIRVLLPCIRDLDISEKTVIRNFETFLTEYKIAEVELEKYKSHPK